MESGERQTDRPGPVLAGADIEVNGKAKAARRRISGNTDRGPPRPGRARAHAAEVNAGRLTGGIEEGAIGPALLDVVDKATDGRRVQVRCGLVVVFQDGECDLANEGGLLSKDLEPLARMAGLGLDPFPEADGVGEVMGAQVEALPEDADEVALEVEGQDRVGNGPRDDPELARPCSRGLGAPILRRKRPEC